MRLARKLGQFGLRMHLLLESQSHQDSLPLLNFRSVLHSYISLFSLLLCCFLRHSQNGFHGLFLFKTESILFHFYFLLQFCDSLQLTISRVGLGEYLLVFLGVDFPDWCSCFQTLITSSKNSAFSLVSKVCFILVI